MSIGVIVALVFFVGFAVWGVFLLRSKVVERRSEKSSHSESGVGTRHGPIVGPYTGNGGGGGD